MSADPDFFIDKKLSKTKQGLSFFGKEALEEYKRCFRNPATVHAMCEDYRATHGVDLAMDTEDFAAGKQDHLSGADPVGRDRQRSAAVHKPAEIWQDYATDIRGAKALPCGHYLSEEAPEETYAELRAFFLTRNPDAVIRGGPRSSGCRCALSPCGRGLLEPQPKSRVRGPTRHARLTSHPAPARRGSSSPRTTAGAGSCCSPGCARCAAG